MSTTLASIDKAISGQLKDSATRNIIRVVLVIYIVMITSIPRSTLEVFNNTFFQIAYLALLAYMALLDPASALLMAAAYLFTVQQLNRQITPSFAIRSFYELIRWFVIRHAHRIAIPL